MDISEIRRHLQTTCQIIGAQINARCVMNFPETPKSGEPITIAVGLYERPEAGFNDWFTMVKGKRLTVRPIQMSIDWYSVWRESHNPNYDFDRVLHLYEEAAVKAFTEENPEYMAALAETIASIPHH